MDDAQRIERVLDAALPPGGERLGDAMRYAVLGGGKRIRARLVYAAGRLAGAAPMLLDRAAGAVEMLHAYSLVHDDLPAMDDDDLRRGRPAAHIRFGEAAAILAGDALQALAFEQLASEDVPAAIAARWTRLLARAAGFRGMVGGQMADMDSEGGDGRSGDGPLALAELEDMHRRKTGALLHASVMLGAAAGGAEGQGLDDAEAAALDRFGAEIGLAFQIRDDVLDVTVATRQLGKPQGADRRRGKATYAGLLGIDAAQAEAQRRWRRASGSLDPFGTRADALRAIAQAIVERRR